MHPYFFGNLLLLSLTLWPSRAAAQVVEVAVSVTPTCPYGIASCWPSAREGLKGLTGVESVAETPDSYNCTGTLCLKHGGLPEIDKWPKEFAAVVGEVFVFRGVEVTVRGMVEEKDGKLSLLVPGLDHPLSLTPLRNKLQWNFKKGAARQPEPDERDAHTQLVAGWKKAGVGGLRVEVTGPLRKADKGHVLEVREFLPQASKLPPR